MGAATLDTCTLTTSHATEIQAYSFSCIVPQVKWQKQAPGLFAGQPLPRLGPLDLHTLPSAPRHRA